jgi:hypothetical protein
LLLAHRKLAIEQVQLREEISLVKGALSITQHQLKGKKDKKRREKRHQEEVEEDVISVSDSDASSATSEEFEESKPQESPSTGEEKSSSTTSTPASPKKSVLGEDLILDILYCIEKSVCCPGGFLLTEEV